MIFRKFIVSFIFSALALIFSSCVTNTGTKVSSDSFSGKKRIKVGYSKMSSLINIGTDIFRAKDILEDNGFVIKSGPSLFDAEKSTYLLIVDYGVRPGKSAYIRESLGWRGSGKPISGIIKADRSGKIYLVK